MKQITRILCAALALTLLLALAGCASGGKQLSDGTYEIAVTLSGGTGKASVASPARLVVSGGKMTATLVWSSSNYDYMIVDGVKLLPISTEGHSVFEVPVSALDQPLTMIADTVAMSTPHEIEYTLQFDSASLASAS